MARTLEAWTHAVHEAALSGDEALLSSLFAEGRRDFGAEIASRAWQEALDGLDATAVTG